MSCWAQSCQNVFQVIKAWVRLGIKPATDTGEWGSPSKRSWDLLGKGLSSSGLAESSSVGGETGKSVGGQGPGVFLIHTESGQLKKAQPATEVSESVPVKFDNVGVVKGFQIAKHGA